MEARDLKDVSAHMDTLLRALNADETQMRIERQGNGILAILGTFRRYYGVSAGCTHAEAFLCEEALRCDAEGLFRV